MKTKSFVISLLISLLSCSVFAAKKYCNEELVSSGSVHTAKLSCYKTGTDTYRMVFESVDAFNSYNTGSNFYSNVNGVGGHQVSNNLTQSGNTLTWNITSNPAPSFYTYDFYVYYNGNEAHFVMPNDIDWTQTQDECEGEFIYFVNAEGWAQPQAHLYTGASVAKSWNDAATNMTNTGKTTADGYSIWSYPYNSSYENVIFHQDDNQTKTLSNKVGIYGVKTGKTGNFFYKACASQALQLRIGNTTSNYSTDDASHNFAFSAGTDYTLTTSVTLEANTTYYFKLAQTQENSWYTNSGASDNANEGKMTSENCTNWDVSYNGYDDKPTKILTTIAGVYTFTYDYSRDHLSVTYPAPAACEGTRQHFNNTGDKITYATHYDATNKQIQVVVKAVTGTMESCRLDYRKTPDGGQTELPMTIINGVAVAVINNMNPTDQLHFRLYYKRVGGGYYLTAEGTGSTDANMIRLNPVSDCESDFEEYVLEPTTVPNDPEDLNDCQIFSLFGLSSFMNKGLSEFQFWDGAPAGTYEYKTIEGKDVCYVHGQPAGKYAIMSNAYDITAYDKFHVDLWTPNTGQVHIRLIGYSGGWLEATNYKEYNATAGTWLSIDANVSDFTFANAATAKANMKGLMIVDMNSSMCNYHIANMYFYKSTDDESCYTDCGVDVANGKQTWAGCNEDGTTTSDKAVDGTNAMWQTGGNAAYANQWWVVDLGRCYDLDKITLTFENARTKHMLLQTRKDTPTPAQMANSGEWTTIVDVSGAEDGGGGTIKGNWEANTYDVSGNKGRYIRFKSEENTHNNAYGCKIRLFKVCVTGVSVDDANPPVMGQVTYISPDATNTGAIIQLSATDEEGPVTKYRINDGQGNTSTVTVDGDNKVTIPNLATGNYTITAWAIDGGNNVSANSAQTTFCFVNQTENIAKGKTAEAGHSFDATVPASNVVDGDENTRWFGQGGTQDQQWLYLDLDGFYQLSQLRIKGTNAFTNHCIIQARQEAPTTSDKSDDTMWYTIYDYSPATQEGWHEIVLNNPAHYVRVKSLQSTDNNAYGMGIYEMQVKASACVDEYDALPILNTPTATYPDGDTYKLHLTGTDSKGGDIRRFRITDPDGNVYVVDTDNDGYYSFTTATFPASIKHTLTIQAMDQGAQFSEPQDLVIAIFDPLQNLALNKPRVAYFTGANAAEEPQYANDGRLDTYWTTWGSDNTDNEWWYVDLGDIYKLSEIDIYWDETNLHESLGSERYILQVRQTAPSVAQARDDNAWATVAQQMTTPNIGRDEMTGKNAYMVDIAARYVRLKSSRRNSFNQQIRLLEMLVYGTGFGEEYVAPEKPIMLTAEAQVVRAVTTTLRASAYAGDGAFDDIYYYVELTDNTSSTQTNLTINTSQITNGTFTLYDLTVEHSYTANVWALIEIGGVEYKSDNFKTVNFATTKYSDLHFLAEESFPTAALSWEAAIGRDDHRFEYTDVEGLYRFEHILGGENKNVYQYQLYDALTDAWTNKGQNMHICNHGDENLLIYAIGQSMFVTNLDELYLTGDVIGDADPWEVELWQPMTYDGDGVFSWHGNVTGQTNFKITKKERIQGCDNIVNQWDRIMTAGTDFLGNRVNGSGNAFYDRSWNRAYLYFDLKTWTWWWENDDPTACHHTGYKGGGQEISGYETFPDIYLTDLFLSSDFSQLHVEAAAGGMTNLSQIKFAVYKQDGTTQTWNLSNTGHDTYHDAIISVNDIPQNEYGVIAYALEFEDDNGKYLTEKHYYVLKPSTEFKAGKTESDLVYQNRGCGEEIFVIYHQDDKYPTEVTSPDTKKDRQSFAGGWIPQQIEYRHKYDRDMWYSLCLPFEVTAVKVWNAQANRYYDLLPYYRDASNTLHGKQYIIRKATPTQNMPIANFENRYPSESVNGWFDPDATEYSTFLPEKDAPYIIQFHNSYYTNRWICFFGEENSVIEGTFTQKTAPSDDDVVNIYGNPTMQVQSMTGQTYHLNQEEYEGMAWTRYETGKQLKPFECYILANDRTTTRYPILRRGGAQDPGVGTRTDEVLNDAVRSVITVYSVSGQILNIYYNTSLNAVAEELGQSLQNGLYLLSTPQETIKMIIGDR